MYSDSVKYFKKRFETVGKQMAFVATELDGYYKWKTELISKLRQIIGYSTMLKTAANPVLLSKKDKNDYVQYHMMIDTEPGVKMPFFVLKPKKHKVFYRPVIACHGHNGGGKSSVAGEPRHAEEFDVIKQYNYDYGRQLAEQGFIVFCPDARGFGERKEPTADERWFAGSCQQLNQMAYGLGQTITGMWTWDLHRLIDYIETRDDCNIEKLCCVGLSGGALQTLWATALDERIKAAVISGYFYGYNQSLLEMHNNCLCNYVPRLWEYVDMGDIGALIAPRYLMIETGDEDPLNGRDGLENVYSQIEITKRAYELFGCRDRLLHSVCHGEHKWYGTGVFEWLGRV